MIPVSYRASPVFYVQTARFIVFDTDPEVITLMGPSREDELAARVAMLHGFAGAALVGGRAPLWDTDQTPLRGFFEVVQDLRLAGQSPSPA